MSSEDAHVLSAGGTQPGIEGEWCLAVRIMKQTNTAIASGDAGGQFDCAVGRVSIDYEDFHLKTFCILAEDRLQASRNALALVERGHDHGDDWLH